MSDAPSVPAAVLSAALQRAREEERARIVKILESHKVADDQGDVDDLFHNRFLDDLMAAIQAEPPRGRGG
jgi:hypothetical protein